MSILVNQESRMIVQGITGKYGTFYSQANAAYGSRIVAGVSPGKGGSKVNNIPVFDTVMDVRSEHEIDVSIIWVPGPYAAGAIQEAIAAQIPVIVAPVDGIPVRDTMMVMRMLRGSNSVLIGPNTPGIITPGEFTAGFMPANAFSPGPVGVASRSGTLTYQIARLLTKAGIGQSTALGIGGDPFNGFGFVDALTGFEQDPDTRAIVLICEIGGQQEEMAARYIQDHVTKPVVAFIGGRMAQSGRRMGHAGAIVTGEFGSFDSKRKAFDAIGVPVADLLTDVPGMIKEKLE